MVSRFLMMVGLLALLSASVAGQGLAEVQKDNHAIALEELEDVIIEARKVDDKGAMVNVRARAAMLLSYSDPARAESMFLDIWKFVNDQPDPDFDKQKAGLIVLKYLFTRNPKLARQLLAENQKADKSRDSSGPIPGDDDQAAKLASQLIDADPSMAAALLEKSLTTSPTADGLAALLHLRETNSLLSDYLATKTLDSLLAQPTIVSLSMLHLMMSYVFPGANAVMTGMDTESSLEALQYKYFLIGYELLKISLNEPDALLKQRYTARDLQYRATHQALIAAILAALAPRFQPSFAVELQGIAARLAPQVPAGLAPLTQVSLAKLSGNSLTSDDPETSFIYALSTGKYDEAHSQLERINDEKKRTLYSQLLIKAEARSLLGKSDVMGALTLIRKLEDPTRLVMYLDAIKAAKKKRDADLTRLVINEARLTIPQTDRNGIHVQALLLFVGQLNSPDTIDDALEFLTSAVTSINALVKRPKPEGVSKSAAEIAMAEINDPHNLIESSEMDQAFNSVGLRDLERGLVQAKRIDLRSLQLIARLEVIQGIIKRPPAKPKTATKPVTP